MKIAIMQPYFFPYLGYFNLMAACDVFISLDNVQYISRGWVNRNRILQSNGVYTFTVPLTAASRDLWINQRTIAPEFEEFKHKFIKQLYSGYRKAPFYPNILAIIEEILNNTGDNIARLCESTLMAVMNYLGLTKKIYIASQLMNQEDAWQLCGKHKLIKLLQLLHGTHYLNPVGGMSLYQKDDFSKYGIKLLFVKPLLPSYRQGNRKKFYNRLSIIDVLMFNSRQDISNLLKQYKLIS